MDAREVPGWTQRISALAVARLPLVEEEFPFMAELRASRDAARAQATGVAGCLSFMVDTAGNIMKCTRPQGHEGANDPSPTTHKWVMLPRGTAAEILHPRTMEPEGA